MLSCSHLMLPSHIPYYSHHDKAARYTVVTLVAWTFDFVTNASRGSVRYIDTVFGVRGLQRRKRAPSGVATFWFCLSG
jgi:hypothetical protein